jgi:hypothetical protein
MVPPFLPHAPAVAQRLRRTVGVVVIGLAAVVFWRTAYPTITWWDSGNYSLAAATLGITASPGSLLLTLLGWPLTRLPLGIAPAHILNLFAGVLAAITAGLVYVVALRIVRNTGETRNDNGAAIGAALGALTFAFSATLWEHAIKFTPYVLTALFTALILLAMVRWWEVADQPNAWRWLALLALLFGLDFSVHRTNALLIPGALAWILVRHPRTLLLPRSWLAASVGMAAGLALQLLVIPISAGTRSTLNMFEPSNWSRFWDYVSLAQSGGGFLIELWPRNGAVWFVQVRDFLLVLGDNFIHRATAIGILGWLPAIAAVLGLLMLWRRNRRLGLAFTLLVFLHAAMTVLYFNIPPNYFRSFDRHYLPVFVTLGILIACGLGIMVLQLAHVLRTRRPRAVAFAVATLVVVPGAQLIGNWRTHDASKRYFTRDYAINALEALPPNTIYFTVGDNDSFPVWYLQSVEGVRPDVRVVNLSMANASWYVDQLARRDPSFPVTRSADGGPIPSEISDTTAVIAIRGTAEQVGLPADTSVPASITVRPRPTAGNEFVTADAVLLDIVRTNQWQAPLAFSITVGDGGLGWLKPYARLEGVYWRIIPVADMGPNREKLRSNLLERYDYRGYADPSITIDDTSRTMAFQYLSAFTALLDADRAYGAADRCREAASRLLAILPPERLTLPGGSREEIEARCRS